MPIRSLTAAAVLVAAGCGGPPPATGPDPVAQVMAKVPPAYHPYLRDGKVVPTGEPTLDHWVWANCMLSVVDAHQWPNGLLESRNLRAMAAGLRGRSAAGVDPAVAGWVTRAAALLDARATILEASNDPGLYREMTERAKRGDDGRAVFEGLNRQVDEWLADRARVVDDGRAIAAEVSARIGRTLPPPAL